MQAMDGIRSCKGWPFYLQSSPKQSTFAPPFSANAVSGPSVDLAEFKLAISDSNKNNSPHGYDSFSQPLGELDSVLFSKPHSHGYSGFQFTDPLISHLTRASPPDWSALYNLNLNTEPREIEHPCHSPSLWNQFLEFNKGNQGHVKSFHDDGALDRGNFSKIKVASPMPKDPVFSDSGRFHWHLDPGPNSSNNAMLSNWNVPIFKASSRIPNLPANLDIDKSLDGVDERSPAVDSPCWNGAPAAHSSLFDAHEALHPELIDKIEECLASYLEGPKDFHVEIAKYGRESCEISNKNKMQNEIGSHEKGLTGLVAKISVSNCVSQERNSDGVVNDARSDVGKQVIEENKFMSQNQNSSCRCKDVGFDVSECLECSSSQEAENGLSSPSLVAGAPETASAKVWAPKLDIQMLVKMLHNMSEMLLGHCLTDEFQLNGQDRIILENVISNIQTCTLKNPEQMTPAQKRIFPELDSGNLAEESRQLQQNSLVKEPHISKVGAELANVELGKERGTISDSPRISGDDPEMGKADNMVKAMKRNLSLYFREEEEPASHTLLYNNLWLEAEAELCSLMYIARFNRMIEVEKYSSNNGDNALVKGEQSKTEAEFKLSADQNSANKVLSGLKLIPNPEEPIASEHESKGSQNKEAEHVARFHALIYQHDPPIINTDLSDSVDSGARDMAFDGTDASESPSLMDDSNPEVEESILEDNREIQTGSCHKFGYELVTDEDSDDWELV